MIHAEKPPPLVNNGAQFSDQTIIDVEEYFHSTIANYTLMEKAASEMITDLAALTPEQIFHKSRQLARIQRDLVSQDSQIIAILNLAGPEILHASFIKDYQNILENVSIQCDRIWEDLLQIKKTLLHDSTTHRNLDIFIKTDSI